MKEYFIIREFGVSIPDSHEKVGDIFVGYIFVILALRRTKEPVGLSQVQSPTAKLQN